MQLLLVIGGLALVFLTEYDLFGWIVFGIGIAAILIPLLFVGAIFGMVSRESKRDTFNTTYGRTRRRR